VKQRAGRLPEAFSAIRQGKFGRAFELADLELKDDPDSFWGWYLAAVALGFLDRRSSFLQYLDEAKIRNAQSPYVVYLRAYTHLWKENLEAALMDWTSLVDLEEGWLARELIEKARKGVNLVEKAGKGDIAYFIVLPDFIDGISRHQVESQDLDDPGAFGKSGGFSLPRVALGWRAGALLVLVLLIGVAYVFRDPLLHIVTFSENTPGQAWKNYKIDEWAALVNPQNKDSVKYVYKSKDRLIEDFEEAKKKLTDSKFNQARFLLQRILYSNADFKTKEKSKIFLNFIPEPDYQDFSDPVFPDKLMETPEFYSDCLVLWQGSVLKLKDVDHGKEVSLLIKDSNTEYLVDAFLQGKESKTNWLPFTDFQKKKEVREKKPQAIVYGKFKGIIGKQKKIYLELIQLWM